MYKQLQKNYYSLLIYVLYEVLCCVVENGTLHTLDQSDHIYHIRWIIGKGTF